MLLSSLLEGGTGCRNIDDSYRACRGSGLNCFSREGKGNDASCTHFHLPRCLSWKRGLSLVFFAAHFLVPLIPVIFYFFNSLTFSSLLILPILKYAALRNAACVLHICYFLIHALSSPQEMLLNHKAKVVLACLDYAKTSKNNWSQRKMSLTYETWNTACLEWKITSMRRQKKLLQTEMHGSHWASYLAVKECSTAISSQQIPSDSASFSVSPEFSLSWPLQSVWLLD